MQSYKYYPKKTNIGWKEKNITEREEHAAIAITARRRRRIAKGKKEGASKEK